MKYICIAALCVCFIIGGRMLAAKYRRQIKASEAFLLFLSFAKSELIFSHRTVLEIVQKYTSLYPKALPFLESVREPLSTSVKENLKEQNVFDAKQNALIGDFFESFGMQDAQAGEQLIERYILLFEAQNETMRTENTMKIKLIERLSLLFAAGIAIILF